jgi:hypothetical protein
MDMLLRSLGRLYGMEDIEAILEHHINSIRDGKAERPTNTTEAPEF